MKKKIKNDRNAMIDVKLNQNYEQPRDLNKIGWATSARSPTSDWSIIYNVDYRSTMIYETQF